MTNTPSFELDRIGHSNPEAFKSMRLEEWGLLTSKDVAHTFGGNILEEISSPTNANLVISRIEKILSEFDTQIVSPFAESTIELHQALSTMISIQLNKIIALFQSGQLTYKKLLEACRSAEIIKEQAQILQYA